MTCTRRSPGCWSPATCGPHAHATLFLFDRQQQSDGSMPRNSLLNGKVAPDTGGLQLDETSYPILMDWQSGLAGNRRLYRDHVIPAADFLVAHGPSDGVERWEEQSGYSPSTISAEIAGLTAAASIARVNGDSEHAAVYQATADDFARNIKNWTVTTTGPYGPSYFIRLSKTGDPNVAIPYNLGNGSVDGRPALVIDAGFLELVRLGVLPASDPDVAASLTSIDDAIERQTPSGTGFYRYGTDAHRLRGRLRRLLRARPDQLLADRQAVADDRPDQPSPTSAPATCGRCWAASAASTTSPPATAGRRHAAERDART